MAGWMLDVPSRNLMESVDEVERAAARSPLRFSSLSDVTQQGAQPAKPQTRICSCANACTYSESSNGALQPRKAQQYAILPFGEYWLKIMHAFPVSRAKHLPEHLEASGAASRSQALDLYCRSLLTNSSSLHSFLTFGRNFLKAYALTYLSRYPYFYQSLRNHSL